jgi:putative flippase GtrA
MPQTTHSLPRRFVYRLSKYTLAGGSTFFIDLALLYLLSLCTTINHSTLIVLSFIVGSTLNYLLCYLWVYRGTSRKKAHGYVYFLLFELITLLLIVEATNALIAHFGIPLIVARICVGIIVGCINFLLNTFLNFKLL